MNVIVNDSCIGCGACVAIDPDHFEFDDNGLCIAQRDGKQKIKVNGCCGKCIYVGKKGCTIRNITCKTFFCKYIKSIKEIPNYKENKL